jgi:hypothetical protein
LQGEQRLAGGVEAAELTVVGLQQDAVRWSAPVALPSDPDQVLIADDRKKLYRLRVGDQVRELASVDLEQPLLGPTAIAGEAMFATMAGPSADFLVSFHSGSLESQSKRLLDGRVTWGPFSAADRILLQTDDGQLRGFDAAGEPLFALQLPAGRLVQGIAETADAIILTGHQPGWLAAISKTDGSLLGTTHLNQPLSAPPLPVGNRLLVPGHEGIIYITEVPSSVDGS